MQSPLPPPRFFTRSRIRRLRTAGVTGVVLGTTMFLWGPVATGPTGQEVNLQAAASETTVARAAPTITTVAPATTTTTLAPTTTSVARTTTTAKPRPAPATTTTRPRPVATTAPVQADPNRLYGVGFVMLNLANGTRALPTIVRYPAAAAASGADVQGAAPASAYGPFPLIVFSAGFDSSPAVYGGLMHAWSAAGYVVAAPYFPYTTMGGPLNENDVVNQPGDLSAVISSVLSDSAAPGNVLSHLVDGRHIAAAGHSDGGETVMGIAANSCCLDHRLSAAIEMSGAEIPYPGGHYFPGDTPPLLAIQGDDDPINNYSYGVQIYDDAPAPKYFLTLLGAGHLEPFTTDTAHLIVSELCTIDFLNYYLKGHPDGIQRLIADAVSRSNAKLTYAA